MVPFGSTSLVSPAFIEMIIMLGYLVGPQFQKDHELSEKQIPPNKTPTRSQRLSEKKVASKKQKAKLYYARVNLVILFHSKCEHSLLV
jgi:hypothetical protein